MNMKYKINEIAKYLNLSKQMIRYYEQCGVIQPERMEGNNYRLYDTMDYFALGEAISLSRFNVNIKDIYKVKSSEYTRQIAECCKKYIEETNQEIAYKTLLKNRAQEILDRVENAELNINNIWIKKINAHRLYPLLKSNDDEYGEIEYPEFIGNQINSSEVIVFGEGYMEINDSYDQWWMSFNKSYVDALKLPEYSGTIDILEQYCLCSVINMGKIGEFKTEKLRKRIDELLQTNYVFTDKPRCLLLCRGVKDGDFRRLLEIQIPIQKP